MLQIVWKSRYVLLEVERPLFLSKNLIEIDSHSQYIARRYLDNYLIRQISNCLNSNDTENYYQYNVRRHLDKYLIRHLENYLNTLPHDTERIWGHQYYCMPVVLKVYQLSNQKFRPLFYEEILWYSNLFNCSIISIFSLQSKYTKIHSTNFDINRQKKCRPLSTNFD